MHLHRVQSCFDIIFRACHGNDKLALTMAGYRRAGIFPEACEAAEQGVDLWLLDEIQKMTPWERIKAATSAARLAAMLREAGRKHYGV